MAKQLVPQGWTIFGTTRSAGSADAIRAEGVHPLQWEKEAIASSLEQASHLLISAGPDEAGDPSINLLGEALPRHAPNLEWAGYLSTTGVYGNHDGAWTDETTPVAPTTRRGELRAEAEAAWAAIPDLPLHIFRLAGIYGPGRGPFSKVKSGTARRIVKDGQVFSRIHVDDIAQVLEASIQSPNPGAIYNVCDDEPAPPQDVIAYAATLLGMPLPPEVRFEEANLPPMARSFYMDNKRTSNTRIKRELGVTLRYPDYRTGLKALCNE